MSERKCNHRDENHQLRRDIVWEEFDARGISVGMVCDNCVGQKRSQYRPEVFTDPNYSMDEPSNGKLDECMERYGTPIMTEHNYEDFDDF